MSCLEFADKILIFAILKQWLLQQRETEVCFVYVLLLVCFMQVNMGLLSSKFAADLQRAKEELELARQTLTADIARVYNMFLCIRKLGVRTL